MLCSPLEHMKNKVTKNLAKIIVKVFVRQIYFYLFFSTFSINFMVIKRIRYMIEVPTYLKYQSVSHDAFAPYSCLK